MNMNPNSLFQFQEEQKKIFAMLPPLKSKYIDYSEISFSGKSSHKAVFHLKGLKGDDLKKAIEKDSSILSYFNEAVLDQGLLYIHAYFDLGKYFLIEKDGDYEILVEGNGEDVVKNLIVVGKGISCRIFFKTLGKGDLHISNSFYVEEKSECKVGVLNSFDGNLFLYNRGFVEAESMLDFYHASFSRSLERVFHEIYFIGDKARGNIFDLYFCGGQMDLNSRVYCKSRMNRSYLLSKGLVDSLGKVYFEGYAKIDNHADGADLFVGEHAIVLNKGAKANLVPNLEIENNNVKAGHAASVQQFDEEKLFYMQSRGLSEAQCKKLLIDGFLMSVIEKMEIPILQEEIQRRLQEHDAENL